jgi:hypothetical protein
VTVTRVTPFSQPEGVFTVTHRSKTYPAYTPKATRQGSRVVLLLWNEPGSFYRVDFTVKLGPQALERLREADIPDPEAMVKSIVRPVDVTEIHQPFRSRVAVKLSSASTRARRMRYEATVPRKGASKAECFLMAASASLSVASADGSRGRDQPAQSG